MSQPCPPPQSASTAAPAPGTSSSSSNNVNNTALFKKERHYAALAGQLGALSTTLVATRETTTIAAEQAHYIRNLGIGQAAAFMATLDSVLKEGEAVDAYRQQQQKKASGAKQ